MADRWQTLMRAGTSARLAYGAGSMIVPEWMARNRLTPTLRDHPDPRMNLRGFGGAQSAIALYTLTSLGTPAGARSALRLDALADGLDTVVSLLEGRDRGRFDEMAAGGVAVNVAGLTCWTIAWRGLRSA